MLLPMAKKKIDGERMRRELDRYGMFNGYYHPDTAEQPKGGEIKLSTVIQRILMELRGIKDPALLTILRKQIQKAEVGDVKAATFLFDRAFGMPVQTSEHRHTGEIEYNLNIVIKDGKEKSSKKDR